MLHTFLNNVGPKLVQEDRRHVYEAIAYVFSAMPMEKAAVYLKTFSVDILTIVHGLANVPGQPTAMQIEQVAG